MLPNRKLAQRGRAMNVLEPFGAKVFAVVAFCGKSTMDWFFGFKLHLVVNERREPLAMLMTSSHYLR
jgi:hypothetical protein